MSSAPAPIAQGDNCYLLQLPVELQLAIYELVLIQNEPYLLNFPCNSSYRGRREQMHKDEDAWKSGEKHPPHQPALTRTCRSIRAEALPIFYKTNIFRAGYCTEGVSLHGPIQWLRAIGSENREALRHLYFYDRNETHDANHPKSLRRLKSSEVCTEMGGKLETIGTGCCCAHLVTFGEWERRDDEVPLAFEAGAMRLRMGGEG